MRPADHRGAGGGALPSTAEHDAGFIVFQADLVSEEYALGQRRRGNSSFDLVGLSPPASKRHRKIQPADAADE
jgi:hypothetical protein